MAIIQNITAMPTPALSRTMQAEAFITASDADIVARGNLVTELNAFATQANATAAAMNLNSTTDTSATSNSIATGAKTFTVTAGKSFQPGMWLIIADTAAPSTNQMLGSVTSYATDQLVMNITSIIGSGTKTAWTISQSAASAISAEYISNTPAGSIAATTVQAAINELDTEKAALAGSASQAFSVANLTASSLNGGAFSGSRNKIIGGDFTTNPWQRGVAFTASGHNIYTADRWKAHYSTDGVVDVLKTADAPTAAEAGSYSVHCLHLDVTTADASIAAEQYYSIRQLIEGLNTACFGFGQAGIRYVTLSFWHKHSKTGIYCVNLRNTDATRSYVAEYTQAITNTWEKAIITIPVDISGTWLYDTGVGIVVNFIVACGSTYQTTANTWAAGAYMATANQVNALDSTANNFKLALIQLEYGSTATPFETLDVGTVLKKCQRYCCEVTVGMQLGYIGYGWYTYQFPEKMRDVPSAPTVVSAGTLGGTAVIIADAGGADTRSAYFQIQAVAGNDSVRGRVLRFTSEL